MERGQLSNGKSQVNDLCWNLGKNIGNPEHLDVGRSGPQSSGKLVRNPTASLGGRG